MKKPMICLLAAFLLLTPLMACSQGSQSSQAPEPQPPSAQAPIAPQEPTPTPQEPTPTPTPEQPSLPEEQPEEEKEETALYIRLTGDSVNIRSGSNTQSTALGQGEKGSMYAVKSYSGGWYAVSYKQKTAYVYDGYAKQFTLKKSDDERVEKTLEKGYFTLGTPYVYGAVRLHDGNGNLLKGFSSQKFDCSSLVQYAFYYGAGKNLGTTTRSQVKQGKYVKKSELQRGDCMFFTNADRYYNTGIERVGHVAIYLGDDYILHTSSDYARIEKMTKTRWNYYIESRRFI